jgi:hypothetical protein
LKWNLLETIEKYESRGGIHLRVITKQTVIIIILILGGWSLCFAELTPKEILSQADMARGNLEGVEWKVHIRSIEKGKKQNRKLDVKARGYDFLAIMTAPPKMKRNKLLMVDHNMWFAKPGVKKPVPVSSRQKLIGGAAYGDIAATNYADDYKPISVKQETLNGELCYLFDLTALTKKATYDRIKYWISQKMLVGVKAEYYTVSGKMFKSATFEFKKQVQLENKVQPFISKMIIQDAIVSSNITTMEFSNPRLVTVSPSALDLNLLMMK